MEWLHSAMHPFDLDGIVLVLVSVAPMHLVRRAWRRRDR